jgi:hypothetical protein
MRPLEWWSHLKNPCCKPKPLSDIYPLRLYVHMVITHHSRISYIVQNKFHSGYLITVIVTGLLIIKGPRH